MYKVGLGDCFLLTFSGKQRAVHMLVDCGVVLGTENAAEKMAKVVEDIRSATNGRLDIVIATHEHWDHLSGFLQASSIFDKIRMDRIWMAWTEDPSDPRANQLKEEFGLQAQAVVAAVRRWKEAQIQPGLRQGVQEMCSFLGDVFAADGQTTSGALAYLKKRRDAAVRYLSPGEQPFPIPGVDGIRMYVLGPPADDKYVRRLLPRAHTEDAYEVRLSPARAFATAVEATPTDSAERTLATPFDEYYCIPKATALQRTDDTFFSDHYGKREDQWRNIDEDWLTVAGQLALDLDNKTNNICLAFALEIVATGEVLLFPGDAQIGNWQSWQDLTFSVPKGSQPTAKVKAADLLARTVFYKVGHHGSHNATHRAEGLERMTSPDLVAMIPVDQAMATQKKWNMPFPPLYRRLLEKCRSRVIRLDVPLGKTVPDAKLLSKPEAARFKDRVKENDLFVECSFPL
jgi:hypothetical protein